MSDPGPSKRQLSRNSGNNVKMITQIGQKAPVAPLANQIATHTSDCAGRRARLLDKATAQMRLALHQSGPRSHRADGKIDT